MAKIEEHLSKQLAALNTALDRQVERLWRLDCYRVGNHPIPDAVRSTNATNAYRMLMGMARSNWPGLIVDSVDERLEVQGIKFTDSAMSEQAWEDWQRNGLDCDSGLVHDAALTGGRAYVIVWGDGEDNPVITPEHGSTVIVQYAEGSRSVRAAAMRRWRVDNAWYATLYRPEAIYKFEHKSTGGESAPSSTGWHRRDVANEPWPLPNPLGVVPVVEVGVNRSLAYPSARTPGFVGATGPALYADTGFGTGAGEFEAACEHIDRINYAMFSAITAMTWSGFPLRAQIGDPILYDDNNEPIQPFKVAQDQVVQIENPDGKLVQLPEANLTNYNSVIEMHVKHLAAITKTPAHYLLGEMVNLSADAIRAAEAGLISKIKRHHRSLGEGWEEVMRLASMVRGAAPDPMIQVEWADPESRSLAERADAALKLANIMPWQALASKVLAATPQEIAQWEASRASEGLNALIAAPEQPEPPAA